MILNKVINISFPRSGHHMMHDVLHLYFGDDLKYCDWQRNFLTRPEICEETNFTKVHDHYLTYPVEPDKRYLVLVRNPLYSIASWRVHHRDKQGDIVENQETSKLKVEFWSKWMNKWVLSDIPNRLIVQYESMIHNSLPTFEKIVRFISDEEPDLISLRDAIVKEDVREIPNTTKDWIGWI